MKEGDNIDYREESEMEEEKLVTIYIRAAASSCSTEAAPPAVRRLRLRSLEDRVDLRAIGKSLPGSGEPRTLRLNGHFIGSGGDGVSALSWASLVSFFSSRGHACGLHPDDPICVSTAAAAASAPISQSQVCHGKGLSLTPEEDPDSRPRKRRISSVEEDPQQSTSNKKLLMQEKQQMMPRTDHDEQQERNATDSTPGTVDHSILWMKRKLNLDDENAGDRQREGLAKRRTMMRMQIWTEL